MISPLVKPRRFFTNFYKLVGTLLVKSWRTVKIKFESTSRQNGLKQDSPSPISVNYSFLAKLKCYKALLSGQNEDTNEH